MDIISICVSFVAAILGVAYPILLQVISRIDEKYYSLTITDSFEKEPIRKLFICSLFLSLTTIFIYTLECSPPENMDFLYNSAEKIALVSTIFLIVIFFLLTKKILVYYNSNKIILYFIKRHSKVVISGQKASNTKENEFFLVLSDLLFYSIKIRNKSIALIISDTFYKDFDRIRFSSENKTVTYKPHHYELTNKLTELLATNEYKEFNYLKDRATGGLWLLGEGEGYKISENTYAWLWQNLKTAIEYKDQDMLMAFWMNAHQHISYRLDNIQEEYVDGIVKNQKEIEERNKQRNRFLQFTTALGGLLIYLKQYGAIQRCFRFTQSTPPTYELLPKQMDDVFEWYIHFRDPYSDNYSFMGSVYSFPNIEGLNEDGLIKRYICKYIALLFLRQYTLQVYYVFQKPLAFPNISGFTQGDLKKCIENIDFFRLLIDEVYSDKQLLDEVGFGWLTDEWLTQNEKPNPLKFIDDFKSELEAQFTGNEISQTISIEKKEQFLDKTKEILECTFNEYDKLSNKEPHIGDVEKGYLFGGTAMLNKSAFADEQGVSHLNFDSILAEGVSKNYKKAISNSFFIHKTAHYLLSPEDVFRAIDKLNIDNKFVLVAFKLNFNKLIHDLKIEGLTEAKYKELDIIHFEYANSQTVANTIFVIKKVDLPRLEYLDIDDEEKKKYKVDKPISDKFKLYANVIDLYQNNDVRTERETNAGEDLSKKVLAYIAFKLELQWKRNINCISLKIYSEYQNKGIPNKLSDVKPIKEDKKNSKEEKDE